MRSALCCLFIFWLPCAAQLKLDSKQDVEFYVKNVLLGPGVEVRNITYTGMIGGMGQFDADKKIIGVKSGIVLSTGLVDSIIGPNNTSSQTTFGSYPKVKKQKRKILQGDPDLNKLCRRKTTDIAVIEFDFVPVNNKLQFNFVFASEEYTEYVNSPFNDVFGFFLSGPDIKGRINLAHLPDRKKTPITINTVNHLKHSKYFRRNNGLIRRSKTLSPFRDSLWNEKHKNKLINQLEFDGLTTVLSIHREVIPYKLYHMKIAIGDVSDRLYDSGVFIEAGSFVTVVDTSGKHYATLKEIKEKKLQIDIDSIFKPKSTKKQTVIVTVPEPVENEDSVLTERIVYFPVSSSVPDSASEKVIKELIVQLKSHPYSRVELYGFTDLTGNADYNRELAGKRTKELAELLKKGGIPADKIQEFHEDFFKPRSDNTTDAGRAENRRVEIYILR